jgi:hypothetical protein
MPATQEGKLHGLELIFTPLFTCGMAKEVEGFG